MPIISRSAPACQRPPSSRVSPSRTLPHTCSESTSTPSRSKITAATAIGSSEYYDARMEEGRVRELLANARARIEAALASARGERDTDDGPRDASDDAADLFDEELGEGIADRLRQELA